MRTRSASLATLFVVVGACGGGEAAAPPPTLAPVEDVELTGSTVAPSEGHTPGPGPGAARTVPGKDASVVLVDPGAEPRHELRAQPEVGATRRATVRQAMSQRVEVDGASQPAPSAPVEFDVLHTVEAVDGDRITVSLTYEGARVESVPGIDAATMAQVDSMAQGMVGSTAQQVFDHRMRMLSLRAPDSGIGGAAGEMQDQTADEMALQSGALSSPFPEAAVGVGAVWEVRAEATLMGVPMEMTSVYELTEVTEEHAAATATLTLRIIPGETSSMGITTEFVGGELTGRGSFRWPLSTPMVLGEQWMEGTMHLAVIEGGRRTEMHVVQRQDVAYTERD